MLKEKIKGSLRRTLSVTFGVQASLGGL